MARRNRFWVAMAIFVGLGVLEWNTLSDETLRVVNGPGGEPLFRLSIRGLALAILLLFALRTLLYDRRADLEERIEKNHSRGRE